MDRINFKVNGKNVSVGSEASSKLTLVDYLRNVLELRGTKYMCREGGCGACIVSVVKTPDALPIAVNACLVSVTSCEGWEITTIEKVGNKLDGYHKLQKLIAKHHGTQCGHCTPGWIMSMYSLQQQKKDLTKLKLEKSFGSNVCRCTGYRPILEAFKTCASDASDFIDIEDLNLFTKTGKVCKKDDCEDDDWCFLSKDEADTPNNISIKLKDGKLWFTVYTTKDILEVFSKTGDDSYMLISGNTAKGAYPIDEYPDVLIDISKVTELKGFTIDQNLIIGAGNTLTETLEIFQSNATNDDFTYLNKFIDHIELVAHISVRNVGSLAGNLMIKHQHNEFPSDIFLLLQTVNAQLLILGKDNDTQTVSMDDFLKLNMKFKIIFKIYLPPLNSDCHLVSFKIMPRSQSAHAIVNAGFLYKFKTNGKVIEIRIQYGGLSPSFSRAVKTEEYLLGKSLFHNETLKGALQILEDELVVTDMPPVPSIAYRKKLALGLFYKGLMTLCPKKLLASQYRSGAIRLHESRPVSQAKQSYETNSEIYPLNQPLQKKEALFQTSGELNYSEGVPSFPREVFATYVLSTVSNGKIEDINADKALKKPGVVAFYTAKDIPGTNSFTPKGIFGLRANEEIVCSEEVKYFNQPVGIIVGETRDIAEEAVKLVEVKYSGTKKPVIDLKEAITDDKRKKIYSTIKAIDRGFLVEKVIKGSQKIEEQYHFCMETLLAVARPTANGIEVHSSTHWSDATQSMISRALKIDMNRIVVNVSYLGGSFGVKISRSMLSALACSLVTFKLNRPCRVIQTLTTNMRVVGKRTPCLTEYEVGVDALGVIQYVDYTMYEGNGYTRNEALSQLTIDFFNNCYYKERWNFQVYEVITDTPKNTWCRAPGSFEAVQMAELFMEHISYELSIDPVKIRLANLDMLLHSSILEMLETLKSNSDYDQRREKVAKFNKENRWKKRGLRTSFLRWTSKNGQFFDVNIAVYHDDGTILITHGGTEMGQGLNTLVAQVCAYILKIDVNKIEVIQGNTINSINNDPAGGSFTASNVCIAVQRCCQILIERLLPIMATLGNAPWETIIKTAYEAQIDLHVHSCVLRNDNPEYFLYGVAFAEVEVDILTGESEILRVDLLQDVGRSINPEIDIGQIEGAFIMGQGYWTSEKIIYDVNTGEVLTDRTWNYYVPQARDIPQDFRIYLKKKSFGKEIILGSKATGEPPICLSVVVALAIREAVVAARSDSGIPSTEWFSVDGPFTTEAICMTSETKTEDYKFN